jgi:hypothetical protein
MGGLWWSMWPSLPPGLPLLHTAPVRQSQAGRRDHRNIYVMNRGVVLHVHTRPGGRMEKLALISQAVSLSVIFYVVTYFLITWHWPETLLSIFVSMCLLYLFFGKRDHSSFAYLSLP